MIHRNRQYKNKSLVLILIVAIHLFTACTSDLLDTTPTTDISELEAFSTPEKILAQVNNLYSAVQNQNYYGGRYVLFNEQRGDEFAQNDANASVGALIWQQNPLSTDVFITNLWSAAYFAINSANIVLDRVGSSEVIGNELKDNYLGEAKFIRALAYFSLVQTYAKPYVDNQGVNLGLPLRLTPQTNDQDNDLARSSVAEVYAQIIQDLDEAESQLPFSYGSAAFNASRAHKSTAIALKTRVYLAKGDFSSVVDESEKLVSETVPYTYQQTGITHELEANIANVFSGQYTGNEAIFFLPFNELDAPGIQSSLAANYLGSVVLSLNPNGIISNELFNSSSDTRKNLITERNGQPVLAKFSRITSPFTDYVPVLRYAEVLLNYAEAAAEEDDLVKAQALLLAVRQRSDPDFSFPAGAVTDKDALINTILTERRIELLGEGFRTPDLQRRLQTLPSKSGAIGNAPAVAPSASNYIWPIPSGEIVANHLIEPNP